MIAFCSPQQFTWQALLDHRKLKLYIDKVQADGIITKLDRLCNALNYLMLEVEEFEKKREDIISIKSRIEGWKSSFKKEKPQLNMESQAR